MPISRRTLLTAAGLLLASGSAPAALLPATPRQTAGPFYPDDYPLDDDNDLVHVRGRSQPALGQVTDLRGRLLDRNGQPLRDTRIEIWQCDANGRYRHSGDPGRAAIDPGFQGLGHATTDAQGRYRFLTIRPVPYPGRTPHIHVLVQTLDERPFVTQLYVEGETRNADDFLYQRIPVERRRLVTVPFASRPDSDHLQAQWDIVLGESRG